MKKSLLIKFLQEKSEPIEKSVSKSLPTSTIIAVPDFLS